MSQLPVAKTNPGNFFEDFRLGQQIRHATPRTVTLGGAWYFVVGFACLLLASQSHALSPWIMGVPFVAGQLLMAAILHLASGGSDAED